MASGLASEHRFEAFVIIQNSNERKFYEFHYLFSHDFSEHAASILHACRLDQALRAWQERQTCRSERSRQRWQPWQTA